MSKWRAAELPDGSYSDDSRPFAQQDLINYIPEYAQVSGTRSQMKLIDAPGLREYVSVKSGPHRGARDVEGKLFIVAGTSLYLVSSATSVVTLGTIPGRARVSMTHNQITGGQELVIATGTDMFVYNTLTQVFARVTDAACPGAKVVDFINQKIVAVEPQGRYFFNSDLANATSYDDLERYESESAPDRLKAIIVSHLELLAFGDRTIEAFEDSADPTDIANHILFRNKRIVVERGLASTHAVARIDNAVMFLGDDGSVYRMEGYTPVRKSNFAIESSWRDSDLSKAFAFVYEDRGHKIFYLTFPDGNTWGYDAATDKWHRRESQGINRWRLNTLVKWNGEWYGGSYSSGMLYLLDWDYYKEGCDDHIRTFRTKVLHDDGNRVTLSGLRVEFNSGGKESTCVAAALLPQIVGDVPNGVIGAAVSVSYVASGGTAPYTYAITVGSLPPGVSMTTGGVVTGSFTTVGSYTWTVTATDATGLKIGLADVAVVSLAPLLISGTLANGTKSVVYSSTLTVSGGVPAYSAVTITAGTLPPGLSIALAGVTITVSGTPS